MEGVLEKAKRKGSQNVQHKYYMRVLLPSGKWKYFYTEEHYKNWKREAARKKARLESTGKKTSKTAKLVIAKPKSKKEKIPINLKKKPKVIRPSTVHRKLKATEQEILSAINDPLHRFVRNLITKYLVDRSVDLFNDLDEAVERARIGALLTLRIYAKKRKKKFNDPNYNWKKDKELKKLIWGRARYEAGAYLRARAETGRVHIPFQLEAEEDEKVLTPEKLPPETFVNFVENLKRTDLREKIFSVFAEGVKKIKNPEGRLVLATVGAVAWDYPGKPEKALAEALKQVQARLGVSRMTAWRRVKEWTRRFRKTKAARKLKELMGLKKSFGALDLIWTLTREV